MKIEVHDHLTNKVLSPCVLLLTYFIYLDVSCIDIDVRFILNVSGGLANLSKLLREDKSKTKTNYVPSDGYNGGENPGNNIVFKTSHLPPIMVALTNSSVFIREVNIYGNKS